MKNFFIPIVICILIHVSSHANPGNSRIKIREIDHRIIRVQFNQGTVSHPADAIRYENIVPGTHHIRVWVKSGPRRRDDFTLVYSGPVQIPAHSDVRTILHRNGQLKVFEVIPMNTSPVVHYPHYPVGSINAPIHYGMEPIAFQHLQAAIDHSSFDNTRLQLARQAISSHGAIRTDQIESLINRLSFESNRLSLAKHAYRFTVDPGNYHRLFPLFRFDSSIRELSSYISAGSV